VLPGSLANKPRCVCRRKSREKGDRENNARPKPFKLPVLALCRCLSTTQLQNAVTRLYHSTGNKERKKKKEE